MNVSDECLISGTMGGEDPAKCTRLPSAKSAFLGVDSLGVDSLGVA